MVVEDDVLMCDELLDMLTKAPSNGAYAPHYLLRRINKID